MIRAKEILELISERGYRLAINVQNGVRTDRMDVRMLDKMKAAGVFKISIGVETGDVGIQEKIKKYLDLEKAVEITQEAKKRHYSIW